MKKNLNGCPGDIAEEWKDYTDDDGITHKWGGNDDDGMSVAMNDWRGKLSKIQRAFELENEIINHTLFDCQTKKQEKHMKKLMEDKDHFKGCRIMTDDERKLRDEGWEIFRKYFYNLWD